MKPALFKNHYALSISIEIFSIVLGILLAFGVNEWRENRNQERASEQAMENIYREVTSNLSLLHSTFHYHNSCHISLQNNSPSFLNIWRGINLPNLSASAYHTARQTRVFTYLKYKYVKQIEDVYQMQEFLFNVTRFYAEMTMRNQVSGSKSSQLAMYQSLQPIFLELSNLEKELIKKYENILLTIETKFPEAAIHATEKKQHDE